MRWCPAAVRSNARPSWSPADSACHSASSRGARAFVLCRRHHAMREAMDVVAEAMALLVGGLVPARAGRPLGLVALAGGGHEGPVPLWEPPRVRQRECQVHTISSPLSLWAGGVPGVFDVPMSCGEGRRLVLQPTPRAVRKAEGDSAGFRLRPRPRSCSTGVGRHSPAGHASSSWRVSGAGRESRSLLSASQDARETPRGLWTDAAPVPRREWGKRSWGAARGGPVPAAR